MLTMINLSIKYIINLTKLYNLQVVFLIYLLFSNKIFINK